MVVDGDPCKRFSFVKSFDKYRYEPLDGGDNGAMGVGDGGDDDEQDAFAFIASETYAQVFGVVSATDQLQTGTARYSSVGHVFDHKLGCWRTISTPILQRELAQKSNTFDGKILAEVLPASFMYQLTQDFNSKRQRSQLEMLQ